MKSEGKDKGRQGKGKFGRVIKRALELYAKYTSGLQRGDFKKLFTQETRGIFQHFGGEEDKKESAGGKIRRAFRALGRVFWGFVLALSPARRIIYGIAFVIFAIASVVIVTSPTGSAIREDVPVLLIYGFIIVSFLLALELADKLSARDEIEIARDIQLSLLPPRDRKLPGFEVASFTSPANDVGGDYHDFAEAEGKTCVAIGDVSGHGLGAGLVMAMAKSAFQAQLLNDPGPAKVLATLNTVVRTVGGSRTLMTFLYCLIDSERGIMTFANAGHIYPLFSRPGDGSLRWLESTSYPLGVRDHLDVECREQQLLPGDLLYLISDGLVETTNTQGESFGYERFLESVGRHGGSNPTKAMEGILDDLGNFAAEAPREDDVTIIIARYIPVE
ncbi:MAG TPA: PP2C family protein-serine/threonine phosphatase [Acidobacteriota bacterium]|nr:PP2C family protein-serine/threonine phosphatase [Acidobacteriota bacterium]